MQPPRRPRRWGRLTVCAVVAAAIALPFLLWLAGFIAGYPHD